ncbi:MAG: type II toxin-antitoxin system VapC family toxin [Archangium sp.]
MSWLLDTNIVSELHKPTPNLRVLERVRLESALFLPAPVWHELVFGLERAAKSRRKADLELFLRTVREGMAIVPYDTAAATVHARERARLEAVGQPPPFVDGAIAAIAISRGLPLATRNVADFRHFEGLRVENWFE